MRYSAQNDYPTPICLEKMGLVRSIDRGKECKALSFPGRKLVQVKGKLAFLTHPLNDCSFLRVTEATHRNQMWPLKFLFGPYTMVSVFRRM